MEVQANINIKLKIIVWNIISLNNELLNKIKKWDIKKRLKKKYKNKREMIYMQVAHLLILCLTLIFIFNILSAEYLIFNIKHFRNNSFI